MITLTIQDEITPLIKNYLANNPRMITSLTKSLGWYVQNQTKKLITNQLPGKWHRRSPLEIRRKLEEGAPKAWLGKLKRAIGYAYNRSNNSVAIGWTSPSAAMEGKVQEFGLTRSVTENLRRYFAVRGVPLSANKRQIKVPQRLIFEPAMDIIYPSIGQFVSERVAKYMANNGEHEHSSTHYRTYRVFK